MNTKRARQPAKVSRRQLLDAAEKLMITEGYAAVTTRRVGADVGLSAPLVHYYYPTTEDLLVAAHRRAASRHKESILLALKSKRPLHALWKLMTRTRHMALGLEFAALANHRKKICNEIAEHDVLIRQLQEQKLSQTMASQEAERMGLSSLGAVMLIEGVARALAIDKNFGLSLGHKDAREFIAGLLDAIEPTQAADTDSRLLQNGERTEI